MYAVNVMIGVMNPPETVLKEFIPTIMAKPNDKQTVKCDGVKKGDLSTLPKHPKKRRIAEAKTSERNRVMYQ